MIKALHGCARLFVLAGIGEISNFDLVKDLEEVVDYMTFSNYLKYPSMA